jgi:MYXO-CTERM domain-containing protein
LKASLVEPVDDDSGVLKRWSCVPDRPDATKPGGPPGHHCEFTIPAKRLNVYPDSVELVWFDGKEVNNPAYAVYVLAHHPTGTNPSNGQPTFDQDNVNRLCSFEWDPYPRKFTISTLGCANDGAFFPEICGDGPYDTSPCSFGRPGSSTRPWWIPLVGLSLAVMRRRRRKPRLWS